MKINITFLKIFINKYLFFFAGLLAYLPFLSYADQTLQLFPLKNYDQTIANWIKPADPNYDKPLLDAATQQKRLEIFYNHYFGVVSPWNPLYINKILQQPSPNDLKTLEQLVINDFNNEGKMEDKIGYGVNFRPHSQDWISKIINNIDLSQFDTLSYKPSHRGIAIKNLNARGLPTLDVYFYSHKLAGEGYPFDNLQMSSLWAGTPLYVLAISRDHAWSFVVTPDYIGWVESNGIARVNDVFVHAWTAAAKKNLAAITRTQTNMHDENGNFLFSAYVGSVFPAEKRGTKIKMMVPTANENQEAVIRYAAVSSNDAALMPMVATPRHFANIMSTLIGRPYGWGNLYFYNDCSGELKNLFVPFGIWLPRHSSYQITAGDLVDKSTASEQERLAYLMNHGRRLVTIIYIGGHVVLYLGNYANPNSNDHSLIPMTYQNIWGLSPKPANRRAVIGKAVLFPMLSQYPEDANLISLANKKYFQIAYLDKISGDYFLMPETINLRALMYSKGY